jgi:predicted DNA-binding transcriptional regulator AlpA
VTVAIAIRAKITTRRIITILRPILVTAKEAGQLYGLSQSQIYELEKQGKLVGTREFGDLRFYVRDLEEAAARSIAEERTRREQERLAARARRPLAVARGGRR